MNSKQKKIVLLVICAICLALIIVWISSRSHNEETYEYEGYIYGIRYGGEDMVLTTINADGQMEFTITGRTKKVYENDTGAINIGDCIRLTPDKKNPSEIKKFHVFGAFSTEGKIVNIAGEDAPYVITTTSTNALRMYKLIPAEGATPAMHTGTPIKVYHQYSLNNGTTQVVADVILPLSDTLIPLTESEIFHIEKVMNYTLKGDETE